MDQRSAGHPAPAARQPVRVVDTDEGLVTVIVGSVPGNSNPASLRTRLRPPSQPASQPAVIMPPSSSSTVTFVPWSTNPVIVRPRTMWTPNSAAYSPRIRSISCCGTTTIALRAPSSMSGSSSVSLLGSNLNSPPKCPPMPRIRCRIASGSGAAPFGMAPSGVAPGVNIPAIFASCRPCACASRPPSPIRFRVTEVGTLIAPAFSVGSGSASRSTTSVDTPRSKLYRVKLYVEYDICHG
jgi:hypothetical protein